MLVFMLLSLGPIVASNAEIGVQLVHIGLQVGIGETVDDLAVLDD